MVIHIVANSETDSVAEIACYHFFEETDFVELDVPAEYQTRTIQYVVQQGTGANVPAIYSTITKRMVVSDSEIVATTDDQKFKKVIFRIPDDQTIRGYLANQFAQQLIQKCVEENSYKIYD